MVSEPAQIQGLPGSWDRRRLKRVAFIYPYHDTGRDWSQDNAKNVLTRCWRFRVVYPRSPRTPVSGLGILGDAEDGWHHLSLGTSIIRNGRELLGLESGRQGEAPGDGSPTRRGGDGAQGATKLGQFRG